MAMQPRNVRQRIGSQLIRESIILAAEDLFAKKTFAGTSIRQIADKAHVNIATIYYYFQNKRALHSEVLIRAYEGLHSYVESAARNDNEKPKKRLYNLLNAAAKFLNENPKAHRLILQVGLEDSLDTEKAWQSHLRRTRALINETIEDGIRSGGFRAVNVEAFSFGLMSALIGFFTSRVTFLKLFREKQPDAFFNENLPFPILGMTLDGLSIENSQRKPKRGD